MPQPNPIIEEVRELFQTLVASRLKRIEGELKAVNTRIDAMDYRIDAMDSKFESKFDALTSTIGFLDSRIESKFDVRLVAMDRGMEFFRRKLLAEIRAAR